MKIGVIDSGIGGIKVLESLYKEFTGNHYIYLFDKSGLPYGNKKEEEIRARVVSACDLLIEKYSVECIILACNTASCVALDDCKKKYDIPVFGLIPPLKSLSETINKRTLVLTTVLTANILKNSIYKNEGIPDNIILAPQRDLAEYVEEHPTNSIALNWYIVKHLYKYKKVCDSIFLGCTHYYYIKQRLKSIMDVDVNDGRERLICEMKSIVVPSKSYSRTEFYYL